MLASSVPHLSSVSSAARYSFFCYRLLTKARLRTMVARDGVSVKFYFRDREVN